LELDASNMASPLSRGPWPALPVGAVVNVSAMIVLGPAGTRLAGTPKTEGYRWHAPFRGHREMRVRNRGPAPGWTASYHSINSG